MVAEKVSGVPIARLVVGKLETTRRRRPLFNFIDLSCEKMMGASHVHPRASGSHSTFTNETPSYPFYIVSIDFRTNLTLQTDVVKVQEIPPKGYCVRRGENGVDPPAGNDEGLSRFDRDAMTFVNLVAEKCRTLINDTYRLEIPILALPQ